MTAKLDVVKPGRAVGEVNLGSTEDEVLSALGDSFDLHVDEWGDVTIEFEALGIRCTFWREFEFRLGTIGVERPTASLAGTKLLGMSKDEILDFVTTTLQSSASETDGVIHDDGHLQEWIEVDSLGLTFRLRDGALYQVDVSCQWSDEDSPAWPRD